MRIVSGINKGMHLFAPKDMTIRPTGDKIKEAVFNMIGEIDENSKILDLFAGTGNIGIEFLARGASECYFIDVSAKSLGYVKKNLGLCNFRSKTILLQKDYIKALSYLSTEEKKFDYIFADPPYDLNCCDIIVDGVLKNNLLKKDGVLIIESDKSEKLFENMHGSVLKYKEKIYGRTRISILRLAED